MAEEMSAEGRERSRQGKTGRDSRQRILAAALELFTTRGYRTTSMREIAERVELTKATLYHHFRSKSDIIQGLLDPVLDRLDNDLTQDVVADDPAHGGLCAERDRFLRSCVDTMLIHRGTLILLLRDTSVYTDEVEIARRVMSWMERATALLAGPDADEASLIHASQAIAAIADPLTLALSVSDNLLRRELLDGAQLLIHRRR